MKSKAIPEAQGYIQCKSTAKGAERRRRRMAVEEMRESMERAFQAYVSPLETVTSFKYLGRALTDSDDDWPEVVANLWKAQNI